MDRKNRQFIWEVLIFLSFIMGINYLGRVVQPGAWQLWQIILAGAGVVGLVAVIELALGWRKRAPGPDRMRFVRLVGVMAVIAVVLWAALAGFGALARQGMTR